MTNYKHHWDLYNNWFHKRIQLHFLYHIEKSDFGLTILKILFRRHLKVFQNLFLDKQPKVRLNHNSHYRNKHFNFQKFYIIFLLYINYRNNILILVILLFYKLQFKLKFLKNHKYLVLYTKNFHIL